MSFQITGKVALITGGASGIGLEYAKELLRNGLKAVTLADVNKEFGAKALQEIKEVFGANKAIFVETDVTDKKAFEDAFIATTKQFKNVDILINNAGIMNDAVWEKEVAINVNGVINGILLGLENYIPKYRTASEGVIVNISSIAGLSPPIPVLPIYCGTKFAVVGLGINFGHEAHYERTKVKVLTLCPGITNTPLINDMSHRNLGGAYQAMLESLLPDIQKQGPDVVAKALVKVIENAKSGTVWVADNGQELYEYKVTDKL